jgi:polysaccharide deacetylase family protein (PEP-CTERM system associated)
VERNIDVILEMLDETGAHATFFVLGWIAERYPTMVHRIIASGHEIASHGYGHQRATEQSQEEFREDVTSAKCLLEDIGGVGVAGYRAPSFSIGRDNLWAFAVLREIGYRYSSSIYPIRHDHYGLPCAPRFQHQPYGAEGVLELPVTAVAVGGRNLPAGGGGYFRLLPYRYSRWAIRRVNCQDRRPCIFYFHPWELDPEQPRQRNIRFKTRFRHYVNLNSMRQKIYLLLQDFEWDRMDRIFLEMSL